LANIGIFGYVLAYAVAAIAANAGSPMTKTEFNPVIILETVYSRSYGRFFGISGESSPQSLNR
jgi:hypothetical protein